jgi:DNA repair protein RecO (recombination protein O)
MTENRREHVYRTEALVIGRFDLGETDRILTLYSPQHGKFRAIAKGIRRPTSRLAAQLEIYSQSRLMLAKGRELDVVTGAETIDGHWALRSDLERFGAVSYLAELLNQLTADRQENAAVFHLLSRSIRLLAEGVDSFAVTRHYELSLLSLLGFRPELYRCINCERELLAEPNAFSVHLGGVICPQCSSSDQSAHFLSVNAQKYIRLLDRSGLAAAIKLQPDEVTSGEIERVLSSYARHHAERDARSLGVMKSIREWRPDYDLPQSKATPAR